jgi:hypothetical protein
MKENANKCGRSRPKDKPYEIWLAWDLGDMGTVQYRVLKKYQSPDKEKQNEYARWFLATRSACTYGTFELGDGYCNEVKQFGTKIFDETADGEYMGQFDGEDF